MITPSAHQTWLFYSPLAQQAARLKDDLLDPVDLLLDDPALVDLVRQCLAKRSPRSTRTGRRGLAPDRLLRCCVMKHLKGWSFRDLERELRSNLVWLDAAEHRWVEEMGGMNLFFVRGVSGSPAARPRPGPDPAPDPAAGPAGDSRGS